MKRLSPLFILCSLLSCSGDIENDNSLNPALRLGLSIRSDESKILSANEHSYLNKVCDSFEIKDILASGLFQSKNWNYKTKLARCSDLFIDCGGYTGNNGIFINPTDTSLIEQCNTSTISLRLSGSSDEKRFLSSDSDDKYYFSDYESHEQGLLKELCDKRSEIQIQEVQEISSSLKARYRFYTGAEACESDTDIICVDVDFGIKNDKGDYKIEYIHSLRVETNASNPDNERGLVKSRYLYEKCTPSSGIPYTIKSSSLDSLL